MIGKLTDPWFEAEFVSNTTIAGHQRQGERIDGADGVLFYCPCALGKTHGAHMVLVSFANPRNAPPAPPDAGSRSRSGGPSRWTMSGTSLADLTLTPSVDVGNPSCWHGFVTNGVVA